MCVAVPLGGNASIYIGLSDALAMRAAAYSTHTICQFIMQFMLIQLKVSSNLKQSQQFLSVSHPQSGIRRCQVTRHPNLCYVRKRQLAGKVLRRVLDPVHVMKP